MQSVIVKDKQTWFDIAVLTNGNAQAAMAIAYLNDRSITDDLVSGEIIKVFPTTFFDNKVVNELAARKAIPASALSKTAQAELLPEGIGFWTIGVDFIVS
jgi:hypothetical protein